jgi:hypothetical protein
MTSEAIKVLMIVALYGALEITLYFSSIDTLIRRRVRSEIVERLTVGSRVKQLRIE